MYWWMKRGVHRSWIIAWLCAGVAMGVTASQFVAGFSSAIWLIFGVILAAFGLWRAKFYVVPLIVVAGCLAGLWRGGIVHDQLSPYKNLVNHAVTIKGVATDDAEVDKKGMTIVRVAVTSIDGHLMSGQVWATVSQPGVKRSDHLTVRGMLSEGFGAYAASMYRAKVLTIQRDATGDIGGNVRDWFARQVQGVVPGDQAALAIGFLTGQNQGLSPQLADAMKLVGLTHIVVASGYNLTILVRLARRLFARISKYLTALFGAGMIGGFVALTGMSPSMSRAGLVAGLSLLAWYYGRKFHPLVLLLFVAGATLLANPTYAWGDLGWQLSFAAFAGVMMVAPLLQTYFFGPKKPSVVRQIVGETLAAQAATLPILVGAFGQVSNVALPANVLVVPLVPLVMLLTFLAGMLVLIWPWLAGVIGGVADIVLRYMIGVTQYFAGLPWAVTELKVSWYVPAVLYVVLIGAGWYMWRVTHYDFRTANLVE